jgi:hypothetical protein
METTVKSVLSKNFLLSDKNLIDIDAHNVINLIDYKLSKRRSSLLNRSFSKFLFNKDEEADELFNNKISAFSKKIHGTTLDYFKQTQNWIGHIIEIEGEKFLARLEDLNHSDTYELATFDFKDVSVEDQDLLSLGSIFYWSVGYAVRGSQIYKESFIRFQRLPPWDVEEFNKVADSSSGLRNRIGWE